MPDNVDQQARQGQQQGQGQSFAERTAARLAGERAQRAEPEPRQRPQGGELDQRIEQQDDPDEGLSPQLESAVDNDDAPVGDIAGDEQDDPEALLDYEENPDGDTDPDESSVDWEKRFKDTQRELTRVNEERRERESEQAQIIESAVALRHEFEDQLDVARRHAAVYTESFNQQIAQIEQAFQTGQIEPDKLGEARQYHQSLIQQRNQIQQQVQQLEAMDADVKQKERERKAEIARLRLSRTIPNWSRETYQQIAQYAQERGFSAKEFAETTDARLIELLHDSMTLRKAGKNVQRVRQKQRQRQPNRTAREQPRSADGRFKQAQQQFRENPNTRGAFANMKLADLQRQRRTNR
jgi:hypothetical protein